MRRSTIPDPRGGHVLVTRWIGGITAATPGRGGFLFVRDKTRQAGRRAFSFSSFSLSHLVLTSGVPNDIRRRDDALREKPPCSLSSTGDAGLPRFRSDHLPIWRRDDRRHTRDTFPASQVPWNADAVASHGARFPSRERVRLRPFAMLSSVFPVFHRTILAPSHTAPVKEHCSP